MKNLLFTVLAVALLGAFVPRSADAAPLGYSNTPEHYLYTPSDLTQWSFGLLFNHQQREIKIGSRPENIKITRYMAQVGGDLFPWLTVHGALGQAEMVAELRDDGETADSTWTVGAQVRLLEYWLLEPRSNEDRFSIEFATTYTETEGPYRGYDLTWEELQGALTFSWVNEIRNTKFVHPWTSRLYLGPVYSNVEGVHARPGNPTLSEGDDVGLLGGIDIQFTRYASFLLEGQVFDSKLSHHIGLMFNF